MELTVVILAAGKGTRMRSSMPKVLHPLAGKPLVKHVIDASKELKPVEVRLVYGHGAELVKSTLAEQNLGWYLQEEQLGTGHAVDQAMPGIPDENVVLILYGDVPLIEAETLKSLNAAAQGDALALLTVVLDDPTGYGRIVRNRTTGAVERIVEQKDAGPEEAVVKEVNTGIMAVKAGPLRKWLKALDNDNAQGEYYLTDVIEAAVKDEIPIATTHPSSEQEVAGVNDKIQLSELERYFQKHRAEMIMRGGVMLMDPNRIDFRDGWLTYGQDVEIDINVIIEGQVTLGDRVKVGPNVILKDCTIGDDTVIFANSIIEESMVAANCKIGPYARLRPGARLSNNVHVGNFVEIKKSLIDVGSKVNHLTYIGDAVIGKSCNIGAGTITCNYDGVNKHKTTIGDEVFVGSNSALIAPITLGDGSTVGAGSTLSKDVPENKLTVARPKALTISNWVKPKKKQ